MQCWYACIIAANIIHYIRVLVDATRYEQIISDHLADYRDTNPAFNFVFIAPAVESVEATVQWSMCTCTNALT